MLNCNQCASPGGVLRCNNCIKNYAYDPIKKTCTMTCSAGLFNNAGQCVACTTNCLVCASASTCSECSTGFFLNPSTLTCGTTCPSGFYPDSTTKKCLRCASPCTTCTSSTVCTACACWLPI
jgi:proprotein convertase subtilisin/kexin type 5